MEANRALRWGSYLIAAAGALVGLNGVAMVYRALFGSGFESGVHGLGGVTRAELAATNPAMMDYITHLHLNVAGLLLALGVALVVLAWFGVRRGRRWALASSIVLPAVFLAHSIPVHHGAVFSYDALQHLGPGALWIPLLVVGAVVAARGL